LSQYFLPFFQKKCYPAIIMEQSGDENPAKEQIVAE
jgi:hypothetical protein